MGSTKRLYICLPEEEKLLRFGEWDHGIVVTDLNPLLSKSELFNYFQRFGTITEFDITIDKSSGWPKGVGFVRYSSSEEAQAAEADGPHYFGGFLTWIRKVITPKSQFDSQLNTPHPSSQMCV
ncbi:MKI67 FHA domain-interacting nucleolar phosphoprotein [Pseudorasbora parva]|uniref:MKI67 FHA domain-interacting nucleolar phosphoprotein n=1 Tax=Pseudorasbora parva TaxID=51549 RepID=UPI00351DD268